MNQIVLLLLFLLCFSIISVGQQEIPLYDSASPGQTQNHGQADQNGNIVGDYSPSLMMYLPKKNNATGAAVIICPGGGYSSLTIGTEGYPIAEYFVKKGIAAFILKYRLPKGDKMGRPDLSPLEDAQQSIKLLRLQGKKWNIDTSRVGMMGFSAGGGHLVATVSTHFNNTVFPYSENISVRPNFIILIYPVVSMTDSLCHANARKKFLGDNPSEQNIRFYSNELQVTEQTSPTLILHSTDDEVVKVGNSLLFYKALLDKHVKAELHMYPYGGHGGFVLSIPKDQWMSICVRWINYITH